MLLFTYSNIYIYIYIDQEDDSLMYGEMGKVLELLGQATSLNFLQLCN